MVLKNNSSSSSVSTSDETMRMNDQYHLGSSSASSHTHPLSDASRLARDKFERGQWRFEDRPKPLSKPQSEEVRFLGWTLYEESGRDHANRKMQRREEMDYERRNRVLGERDVDVVRSEEDEEEEEDAFDGDGEEEDRQRGGAETRTRTVADHRE